MREEIYRDGVIVEIQTLPPPSEADYAMTIQSHIDAVAGAKGYGSGAILAGYVASTVPSWASEAQAFVAWRDAVWLSSYALLAEVRDGRRAAPPLEDLPEFLPAVTWPSA